MPVKLQVLMSIPGKEPREFDYEFDESRISIGRDEGNEIQVPLSTVSRRHCVLFEENSEWYLEDLKSTHGTKHNGKPLGQGGKKLLRDGDVIDLIHFRVTFHSPKRLSKDYSVEKTEALARKMVEEVLASIGKDADVPYLRVMNGPDEGKRFDVGSDVVEATIGRGTDCDFQINDANISRRHALLRRDWNEITIEDAGSKNGVVINDRKIGRAAPLRDADEILLGAVRLTFIDPSAKYIGKLDDIPAFAASETEDGSLVEASDDDDDGDYEPTNAPGSLGTTRDNEAPPPALTMSSARAQGTSALLSDEGEPEPDPFDEAEVPQRLGALEIGLIGLAIVAVVGLAVGVAVLVAGS